MLSLRSINVSLMAMRYPLYRQRYRDATYRSAVVLNVFQSSAGMSTSNVKGEDSRAIVSKKIEVDGMDLSYDVTGTGKHHLFLLPGALGCVKTDFKYQMESMNKDQFTLFGWDPPGYGSSIPPNRTWPDHFLARDAELAAKMMRALGPDKFSLLGWSDGGITALMINIDSWSPGMRKMLLNIYKEDYLRKEFSNWVDAYTRYYTERKGDICRDELCKITCSTLILHGSKDPLVPNVHPEYLAENIKNSQLHVYPDGKHNIHQRYFQEFNSTVESFLTKPE